MNLAKMIMALVVAFGIVGYVTAQEASFQGLGESRAWGVSANGRYVVGRRTELGTTPAYIWDADTGSVTELADLPEGDSTEARAVSNDGLVVAGYGKDADSRLLAIRWQNGIPQGEWIDDFNGSIQSFAWDVSHDGSVVAGYSTSTNGFQEAFRWQDDTMTGLGDLTGGSFTSYAYAVSADGSVIVGQSIVGPGDAEAFRYENGTMSPLGFLPGDIDSGAYGTSADGKVVVGFSSLGVNSEAFRWENGSMIGLNFVPGDDRSSANDVSADGAIVVGKSFGSESERAMIWDTDNSMRDLEQVLVNNFGLNLNGFTLREAYAVSGDGTVIVGDGLNSQGEIEAFRAVIPRTSPSMLLFREADDASWGWGPEGIPGWDHVGILLDGEVYEAHPGYESGDYWDPIQKNHVAIVFDPAVQKGHTLGSFQHDSTDSNNSSAANITAVIDDDLAAEMKTFIDSQMGEPFFNPDCTGSLLCWLLNLNPEIQKHRQHDKSGMLSYTCCGLVERAAEEAGHNFGQGFIDDDLERFSGVYYSGLDEYPMLTPQYLEYVLNSTENVNDAVSWFFGLFDPVDFMLTDPLGRRLGHTEALGTINEIPGALFTGDGVFEQVAIFDPIPGAYQIELVGLGENVEAAIGGSMQGQLYQEFLDVGETDTLTISVPIAANNVNVVRGFQIAGDISDTKAPDDSYLKFNPGITLSSTEPPVWIEFEGTHPSGNPSALAVVLEASANTPGLTQTIEAFNWNTGQYEQIDSQTASFNSDSLVTVNVTDNIADYVESGTGNVKVRVGWRATGPIFLFPWTICIDQVAWNVTEK